MKIEFKWGDALKWLIVDAAPAIVGWEIGKHIVIGWS